VAPGSIEDVMNTGAAAAAAADREARQWSRSQLDTSLINSTQSTTDPLSVGNCSFFCPFSLVLSFRFRRTDRKLTSRTPAGGQGVAADN